MHKGYTINYFIREVQSAALRGASTATAVATELAPRGGSRSQKLRRLTSLVGNLNTVVNNSRLGRTPKARLLTALRSLKSR